MSISQDKIKSYLENPNIIIDKYNSLTTKESKTNLEIELQDALKELTITYDKKSILIGGKAIGEGIIEMMISGHMSRTAFLELGKIDFNTVYDIFEKNMKEINAKTGMNLSEDIPFFEIIKGFAKKQTL